VYGGYVGKVLMVNLTSGEIGEMPISEEDARLYIGGSGLGAKLLYEMTNARTEALGPDNVLIFMTGPITGTRAFSSDRYQVITKSPLTGIFAESDCGGHWGSMLKRSGWDGILIVGKSVEPVYLWLNDGQVEIRDAKHIWGKDTFDTTETILSETDQKAEVVSIGPAGERLVLISCIMTDGKHARSAGRAGVGAVMGSKNLKAIAVKGSWSPSIARREDFGRFVNDHAKAMIEESRPLGTYGTSVGLQYTERVGDLPIKNWYQRRFEDGAKKICGQTMADTILAKRYHCGRCLIGCGRTVNVETGQYASDGLTAGPEYETLGMLGSNLLIDDLAAIAKGNELCNRYGLDTISTGSVIAYSIEAFERGLITADTVGFELEWGRGDILIETIHLIGRQEGIGKLLGQGVKRIADQLGGIAHEFAVHVKGLELPAHDPRAKSGLALGYATSNRGACHLQAFTHDFEDGANMPSLGYDTTLDRFGTNGKADFVIKFQNLMCMFDSLKCCKFVLFGGLDVDALTECLNLVTGLCFTKEDFLRTGERIFNLKRMYNTRCGISRKDDILPPRILTHKRGSGDFEDDLPHLGKMLNEYYLLRCWDEFGIPTAEKLEQLGLSWCLQ
jgi:aldehyde:ferredoxin oxidoreductase